MEKLHKSGEDLKRYLSTDTFPLAIQFIQNEEEIPKGVKSPNKDLKVKISHCQAASMARRYGWTIAMTAEDVGCSLSGHTYGLMEIDQDATVEFFTRMNYASDRTAALNMLQSWKTLKPGQYPAVVYSPLEWTKVPPDVILIYLNAAQLMRCLHASTRSSGLPITGSFSGRLASCTEGVLGSFLDQTPKVVIPGNGDRVWGGTQDHEMAYAFPVTHLEELVKGLAETHETGIRYPIPTYLRYQPEVGLKLRLTEIFRKA